MANTTKIAVVGLGAIGARLKKRVLENGHELVATVTRKTGIRNGNNELICSYPSNSTPKEAGAYIAEKCARLGARYMMLAIPSGGDGIAEGSLIVNALGTGHVGVVTAGKSALANQFPMIAPYFDRIGHEAACGGDTCIPSFGRKHVRLDVSRPFVITAVMNGTLNYAQWCVREEKSPEQICEEAVNLKYAEPPENGADLDPLAMYQGELPDISRKIAVYCNTTGLNTFTGRYINQADIALTPFEEHDLARVMASNSRYVYLVRMALCKRDLEYFTDIDIGGAHSHSDRIATHRCRLRQTRGLAHEVGARRRTECYPRQTKRQFEQNCWLWRWSHSHHSYDDDQSR